MPVYNYDLGVVLKFNPTVDYSVGSLAEKNTGDSFEYQLGTVSKLRNPDPFTFDIGVTMRWYRRFDYRLGTYKNHILASNSFDDIQYIYSPSLAGNGKTGYGVEKQIFADSGSDHLVFSGDDKITLSFNQKQKMNIVLLFETSSSTYTLLSAKDRNGVPFYLRTNSTGDQLVYCNGDFENIVSFANPIQLNTKYLMVIKENQILLHEYDTIDYANAYTLFPEEGTYNEFGLLKDEIVFGEGYSRNFKGKLYGMIVAGERFGFQEAKAVFGKSDIETEDSCSLRPVVYHMPVMHSVISDKIKNYISQINVTSFLDYYRYSSQYSVPFESDSFGRYGVQFGTGESRVDKYTVEHDVYKEDVNKNFVSQIAATSERGFKPLSEYGVTQSANNRFLSTIQTYLNTPIYNLATVFKVIQDPVLRYATVLQTHLESFDQSYSVMYPVTKDPTDLDKQYGKYPVMYSAIANKDKRYLPVLSVTDYVDQNYSTQYNLEKWYVGESSGGTNEDNYGKMAYGSQFGTANQHPGADDYKPHAYPALISAVYAHRNNSYAMVPVLFSTYEGEQTQRLGTVFGTSFFRPMKLGPVEFSVYGQKRKQYAVVYPLEGEPEFRYATIKQVVVDSEDNHLVQFGTGVKKLNRGHVGFYLMSDAPKKYATEYILENPASDKRFGTMHSVTHMYMDRFQFKVPVKFDVGINHNARFETEFGVGVDKDYNPLVQFGVGVDYEPHYLSMYSVYDSTVITEYGNFGVVIHTAADNQSKFLTAHQLESQHDKKFLTTQELEWQGDKGYGSVLGTGIDHEQSHGAEINVGHIRNNNLLTEQNVYGQFDKKYGTQLGTQATALPQKYGVIFSSGVGFETHHPTQFIRWGVIPNKFGVEFTIDPIYSISFRTFNSSAIPRYSEITDTATVAEYLTEDAEDEMD